MRNRIPQPSFRRILFLLGAASGLGCSEDGPTEPNTLSMEINPTTLTITQGESSTISVTIHRGGDLTSPLELEVLAAPAGVTSQITNVQAAGAVTTANIIIAADGSVLPGATTCVSRGRHQALLRLETLA